MVKLYIAWIKCPKCETSKIDNIDSVTLYFCEDAIEQYCEIVCPECETVVNETIDSELADFFINLGVTVKNFGDLFEPLTEDLINAWDINDFLQRI